jgi:hypothetical protein
MGGFSKVLDSREASRYGPPAATHREPSRFSIKNSRTVAFSHRFAKSALRLIVKLKKGSLMGHSDGLGLGGCLEVAEGL